MAQAGWKEFPEPYDGSRQHRDFWVSWEYSVRNQELPADELAWYLRHARRYGGTVLELGCGSGRVLTAMVKRGVIVDGVDISQSMINATRSSLAEIGFSNSVGLHTGDMATFEFPREYASVQIPYNSIQYLGTVERISDALSHWYREMNVGSTLLFMTYHRKESWYSQGRRRHYKKDPVRHAGAGISVTHEVEECLVGTSTVHRTITRSIVDDTGIKDSWTEESVVPLLSAEGYGELVRAAGFVVNTFCDYSEERTWDGGPMACHVARKGTSVGA